MEPLPTDIAGKASAESADAQLNLARTLEAEGRTDEATDVLRRAAQRGSIAAIGALGKHILTYRPDRGSEGMSAIVSAARAGHGEAAHLLAVFIAEGVGFAQSWQSGLAALQHSAELGWQPAQREIAALAGGFNLSPGLGRDEVPASRDWRRVRQSVDVAAWLAVPPTRILSAAPRIFVAEGFASAAQCDWLIELARPRMKPAKIINPTTGARYNDSGRTNSDCHLILPYSDLMLALVRARIANLIRVPVTCFEVPTMLHYSPGQEYLPHYDFLDETWPGYIKEIADGGQRILTFLLYLNEGFEGGETEFPLAGIRYKGRKGDALFFWNVLAEGTVDRQTLHSGLPPTSGEKWLLSQWVRDRAMNVRPDSR